jgi:hypothetical protein
VWCEFHRIANAATPTTTNPATTAARFKTVITNYTQRSWVATLHGVDATLRALLYQETPFTRHLAVPANGNTSDCPAGVSEEQAAANPTWYAKTSGGALITNQIIQAPDNLRHADRVVVEHPHPCARRLPGRPGLPGRVRR